MSMVARARLTGAIRVAALALSTLAACAELPPSAPPSTPAGPPSAITQTADGTGLRTTLSVLTYNVAGLPWPVRSGRDEALRRIGDELRRLRDEGRGPDIVLLQEAFTAPAARVGVRAGYPDGVAGPGADDTAPAGAPPLDPVFLDARNFWKGERAGKRLSSGLYIFSVHPIAVARTAAFGPNSCAGYDCLANKGVMLATVSVPGVPAPVQILNTHLNSRGASGVPLERSLYAHRRQLDEVGLFLDRHLDRSAPFIYGGDFNARHSAQRFDHQRARVPGEEVHVHCARRRAECGVRLSWDGDQPWMDTQDLQGFASGATVSVRPVRVEAMFDAPVDGARLSDHDGFLVTYELSWPAKRGASAAPRTGTPPR